MTETHKTLFGIITFEPTSDQVDRACRLLAGVDGEHSLVDNSVSESAQQIVVTACARHGISPILMGRNTGLAAGLNILTRCAADRECDWMVYFDQDSVPLNGTFQDEELETVPREVALVGSRYAARGDLIRTARSTFSEAKFVIASGTAMRVSALIAAGGYDEDLFLDCVDHEICYRLRSLGWEVLISEAHPMVHTIGETPIRIKGRLLVTRHPRWRRRQMWRNSVVLTRRYGHTFPRQCAVHMLVRSAETLVGSALFREPSFIISAVTGIYDGIRRPSLRRRWI